MPYSDLLGAIMPNNPGSWPSGKALVSKTSEAERLRGFDSYTPRQWSGGRAVMQRFAKPPTAKARTGSIPVRSVFFSEVATTLSAGRPFQVAAGENPPQGDGHRTWFALSGAQPGRELTPEVGLKNEAPARAYSQRSAAQPLSMVEAPSA